MICVLCCPTCLYRSIVPSEASLLDRAAGVHVRFRLGGVIFPPMVLYKIFTHKPLCDINSFAPRNYSKETVLTQQNLNAQSKSTYKQQVSSIRVGKTYFDARVATSTDSDSWYKRDENNNWRPIITSKFNDILTPSWLQDNNKTKKSVNPFHYSNVKRKQDILSQKKIRKREWMMKAYVLSKEKENQCKNHGQTDNVAYDDQVEIIKRDKSFSSEENDPKNEDSLSTLYNEFKQNLIDAYFQNDNTENDDNKVYSPNTNRSGKFINDSITSSTFMYDSQEKLPASPKFEDSVLSDFSQGYFDAKHENTDVKELESKKLNDDLVKWRFRMLRIYILLSNSCHVL